MNIKQWRPDWRKAEEYPDPKDTSVKNERWAWEFLRRSDQYAKDCDTVQLIFGSLDDDKDEFPDDENDHLLKDVQFALDGIGTTPEASDSLAHKYMVESMYPPSTPLERVVFRYNYMPEYACFADVNQLFPIGQFYNNNPLLKDDDSNKTWSFLKCESWSEVVFKFDLELKLEEQLQWAEHKLKEMRDAFSQQRLIELQPSTGRIITKNYRKHLQLLDGLCELSDLSEVGGTLYPNADPKDLKNAGTRHVPLLIISISGCSIAPLAPRVKGANKNTSPPDCQI